METTIGELIHLEQDLNLSDLIHIRYKFIEEDDGVSRTGYSLIKHDSYRKGVLDGLDYVKGILLIQGNVKI